jgi:MFS family permease
VLVAGYLTYGIVYLGFALLAAKPAVAVLFGAYGASSALFSGAERALIAENSPEGLKGTMLGLYGMLQGIGLLLASTIAGVMYAFNSDAPFLFWRRAGYPVGDRGGADPGARRRLKRILNDLGGSARRTLPDVLLKSHPPHLYPVPHGGAGYIRLHGRIAMKGSGRGAFGRVGKGYKEG